MSLSTRALAGIGAVAVIGLGTLGGSIAYASSQGQPDEHQATLVVGDSSVRDAPIPACYNGGNPLPQDAIVKCQAAIKAKRTANQLKSSDVRPSDKIGVGVDNTTADRGWYALTDGGQQGQAQLTPDLKGTTFSGLTGAASVLNQSGTTQVTVVSANPASGDIYAVWSFQLNQKG